MTALLGLTTVELEMLEQAHLRALVIDHHDARSESSSAEARAARHEATASLIARGLLGPGGDLREDDELGLFLSVALDIRVAARVVVVLDRIMGPRDAGAPNHYGARILHLTGAGVCVEDHDAGGVLALGLVDGFEEAAAAASAFLVPPDAAAGGGEDFIAGPAASDLMTSLGEPTVLAELSVLVPVGDVDDGGEGSALTQAHLLALGPRGCFRSTRPLPGRPGPPDDQEASRRQQAMRFSPVDPGWVGDWMLELARTVPDQGLGEGTMTG